MATKTIKIADKPTLDTVKSVVNTINTNTDEVESLLKNSGYGLEAIKDAIDESAGGGSLIIVTTKTASYVGKTITVTSESGTITATFPESKKVSIKVAYTGDYTIACEGSSTIATVNYVGEVVNAQIDAITVYGFYINGSESDPATMVSYDVDYDGSPVANKSFTNPAKTNLSTGAFAAGDWADALDKFLMPKPCMLKYDGTVDYYLNENDYTKKADGTASDVTSSAYGGNAMMEWGKNDKKIYWKVVPSADKKSGTIYIADGKADSDFNCFNFIDSAGSEKDHFYTPIYTGSYISSKIRSLSGQTCGVSQTGTTEISYATANGTGWYIETLVDRMLINFLLIMISKTTNSQAAFGYGRCASSNTSAISTGTMNTKGLFWGSSDQTSGVKVFGMENYWGNTWRRMTGLINANGTIKIKLTPTTADGSTASAYNTDGTGYISLGALTGGTSGGFISEMQFNQYGMYAKTASGSDSTYYTDGYWFNNSQNNFALVGGDVDDALPVGTSCVYLTYLVSHSGASVGACLSYK